MIYNETRYNSHWNTKKLSDLGIFARGKSKHRPRDDERLYEGGGYPLIQTGEVKAANLYITKHEHEYGEFGLAQSKLWDAGTLCITIAANIAETAILSYPMCFPDSVVGFRAYPEMSSELFMHYVFTYIRNSIQNSVSGSIQDNINIDYLSQLDFKVPDKVYQDKVVGILGTIDQKIDTNNRICEELETMAKTIYDYWFTQFDFPDAEGKPYRSSGGAMEWNEQLKRSTPAGWSVGNLYAIAEPINGLACQKYRPKEGERSLPVIKIKEMHEGVTADTESVSANIPEKHKIFDGDILFSWSATLEVMYWFGGDAGLNQHIFKVVPKTGYSKEFVYHQFAAYVINFVKMAEARKTTMGHITTDHLDQSRIVLPPSDVMQAFSEIVAPIHEKIGHCRKENRELTKLRDWLLPMLMNGQATVAE